MKEQTISPIKMNLLSVVSTLIILLIVIIPYLYFRVDNDYDKQINLYQLLFVFIFGIICHEIIHGIFFSLYAINGYKSIRIGIKGIVPYCHCKDPVNVKIYRIAVLMPTIILGLIPILVGFLFKQYTILSFVCIMVVAGTGDLMLIWMLRKFKKEVVIIDHPNKIGFYTMKII